MLKVCCSIIRLAMGKTASFWRRRKNVVTTFPPGCAKWQKPMVDNPLFKGKWHAPLINNPNYKGKWKPRKIPNPDYFFDPEPFKMTSIGGVGIELWSMSSELYFDNMVSEGLRGAPGHSALCLFWVSLCWMSWCLWNTVLKWQSKLECFISGKHFGVI